MYYFGIYRYTNLTCNLIIFTHLLPLRSQNRFIHHPECTFLNCCFFPISRQTLPGDPESSKGPPTAAINQEGNKPTKKNTSKHWFQIVFLDVYRRSYVCTAPSCSSCLLSPGVAACALTSPL